MHKLSRSVFYMWSYLLNPLPQNTENKETFLYESREKIISQALRSECSLFSRHGRYEGEQTLLFPEMSSHRRKVKYTNIWKADLTVLSILSEGSIQSFEFFSSNTGRSHRNSQDGSECNVGIGGHIQCRRHPIQTITGQKALD